MPAPVTTQEPGRVSAPALEGDPAMARCWRAFPGDASQLRTMRRWIEDLLPPCPARDDVIEVAGELAGNAICHTLSGHGGEFGVRIEQMPDMVRVTVADRGGESGPRLVTDPMGEHGRGLRIVSALSVRVVVTGGKSGRLVEADVPWTVTAEPEPEAEPSAEEELAMLGNMFPGLLVWFGKATRQWWAVVVTDGSHRLVGAPSSWELAALAGTLTARHVNRGHMSQQFG